VTRFARTLDYPEELSWLPDWRDASRYPPVEGTSGTRWAWEFLRRNPDYQKAYLELSRSPPPLRTWTDCLPCDVSRDISRHSRQSGEGTILAILRMIRASGECLRIFL